MRGISGVLQRSRDDARGTISILGAFVLVGVVGVSALALEYGHALLQKSEDQRVADLAAYGGALVYASTSLSSSATSAASNIATLNGLSSGVTPSVVSSPSGDGNNAVEVVVTTSVPLMLARVLTTSTTLPVSATAYAEIKSSAPACVIALSGAGTGVTMNGGTSMTAANCAVASDNSFTLSGGAALVTQTVNYAKAAPSVSGGASITAPAGKTLQTNKATTSDPLSPSSGSTGSTEVTNTTARLSTVSSIASPSAPTVSVPSSSTTTTFTKTGVTGLPSACTDTLSGTVYTVTCSGTATFGTITVKSVTVTINTSSGNTYNFNQAWPITGVTLSGSGGTYGFGAGITTSGTTTFPAGTYNVIGNIDASGTTTFGAGTYNVTGAIINEGGSTTTFGAGAFNLGTDTAGCGKKGPTGEGICNGGTALTIAGPSTFVVAGGIYNGGGSVLTLGNGSTSNSYDIGADANTNSINAGTSQSTTLDDATGSGDLFETAGSIVSGGGTCLWIPAATEHDINGSISLAGGTTLGSGIYTVTGYVAFGDNNGGDVTCNGTSVGVSGSNVTFIIGASALPSNNCAGEAFCVAAGFGDVTLTAPSSGTAEDLLVIGPASTSKNPTAGAAFTQGSSGTTLSGAFYFPNGQVSMSGSGTISSGGGCLELIGSQITLGGGSAAASSCTGLGGNSLGTTVTLVQ